MAEQTTGTADRVVATDAPADEVETETETDQWVRIAARAAATKTDDEIVVLRVGAVLGITGFFVICSGRNSRQVKAIADEIRQQVALAGGPKPRQVEGLDTAHWVLIDYGDFVVHVFLDETRQYYELERLWADVPRLEWRESSAESVGE